ncbi:FAD-dependent oxidoreductase [Streptomyces caeni]|uniref:FAD-dependent oxidoreductase n=1 Tax=Streptomyces caeni TaxID=2307231 RepID=A0ABW4IZ97_9ACTN
MARDSGSGRNRHRVLIVGGGTAGITTAARLRRAGVTDIALLDPTDTHWYQPLWTLVGGGQAPLETTRRSEASVMPKGVNWIREAATAVDPEAQTVTTSTGRTIGYDYLVMAPGMQLDWGKVPGLEKTIGKNNVASNYSHEYAPHTWELIKKTRSGTAVFTQPAGMIKCGGAPQKIAYLACDYWRKQGVLDRIRVILVLPGDVMFGVPVWRRVLEKVAARYGIEVRFSSEMVAIDGPAGQVTIADRAAGTEETLDYAMVHAVPPMSAPDWVKASPLSDGTPVGYISVDKHSLQHTRYKNVFALGDAANLPTARTGAAVRKQAPTVVANMMAEMKGQSRAPKSYDGYTSCPLVTARNKMLLAEFDYEPKPVPSMPFVNTTKERTDMWVLKRYGLPALYWHGMLKGRV